MTEQELITKVANDLDWVTKICTDCKRSNQESHDSIIKEIKSLQDTSTTNKSTISYIKVAIAGLFSAFLAFALWITDKVIR